VAQPEDLHEWVSFDDPDEHRTWMVDASFFRSNYMCIYGNGCKGVLDDPTPELMHGCCSFGAHFINDADVKTVKRSSKRLTPKNWANYDVAKKKGWSITANDGTTKTRVVHGACIFHNPPGFEGGTGCALHIAAEEAGERHMDWKPDVCWQVPLRLEEHVEESGQVISIVREWKRRDWGEGGHEFHWWCTESSDAFVGKEPAYEYFKNELTEMMGKKSYKILVKLLSQPKPTPIPHPVKRVAKAKTKN
jgi:hypothetical protein